MFARFDENPAMTLRVIKETKRYGRTHGRTDGQRENSIPPTNKVCGGYNQEKGHSASLLSHVQLEQAGLDNLFLESKILSTCLNIRWCSK